MTSPETPEGARLRVRVALREAREALGLTQGQVAEQMDWSLSKVIRIENGEVAISPNDLRPLLAFLGVTAETTVNRLLASSRTSKRREFWCYDASWRRHLTAQERRFLQYEYEAVSIRHFTIATIPGPLQTDDYARAVLPDTLSEHEAEARFRILGERRMNLIGRPAYPRTLLLLDESVLTRRVGDGGTTADQLLDLLRLSEQRPLLLRVLPYASSSPLLDEGSFDILTLDGGRSIDVLHQEGNTTEIRPDERSRHRQMFETWWNAALDESKSRARIAAAAADLLGSDRSA